MFMRTARLFLRPVFPEDWRDIHRGLADFAVVGMLSRVPWPYRQADAIAFCQTVAPRGCMKFSVTLPDETGAPVIGQIGLEPEDEGHELGYWIGRAWQRRGFAREAVRGVLDMADAFGLERVHAGHFLENEASGKVLRASGFVETGEIRPTACAARGGELFPARRYVRSRPQAARPEAA